VRITGDYPPVGQLVDRDVVVLGAGISGLLLASELSRRFSVVVLEKEARVPNRKYWVTNQRSVDTNSELSHLVDSYLEHMDIIAHDLTSCRVCGPFPMWDSDRLVDHFVGSITTSGGEIVTGARFYSYYYESDRVVLLAGDRKYRASLVVDCMGFSSPIVAAKNIFRIAGYYFLLGGRVPLKEPLEPIAFYNLALDRHPRYIEVFPTRSGDAHATIIMPATSLQDNRGMKQELIFALRQSHLSSHFETSARPNHIYGGIVPVGSLSRRSLNRFFIFGEAGQVNPAATATGFTRMLYIYKQTALALAECLEARRVSARDLEHAGPKGLTAFNRRLQLSVFYAMQRWTSDGFRELVRELGNLPEAVLRDTLFGEVQPSRFLSPANFLSFSRSRSYVLLWHALRAALPIW
jgi:2-polyprenyl-6-methoxyphenol hydroxylase-like FAD-dependent oxidoreductase